MSGAAAKASARKFVVVDDKPAAEAKPAKTKAAAKPAKVETEAAAPAIASFAAVADADHEGAAQPGPEGEAPEGYEIKGNKDSMKFHRPDGQWYDATVAEVWFRTAEAAEAAGFTEAGK